MSAISDSPPLRIPTPNPATPTKSPATPPAVLNAPLASSAPARTTLLAGVSIGASPPLTIPLGSGVAVESNWKC